jgi:hypothetical protein
MFKTTDLAVMYRSLAVIQGKIPAATTRVETLKSLGRSYRGNLLRAKKELRRLEQSAALLLADISLLEGRP